MLVNLAEILVQKGLLKQHMEVDARYHSIGIDHQEVVAESTFTIEEIKKDTNGVNFLLSRAADGKKVLAAPTNIFRIDGMDPIRYARVYGINVDGSHVGRTRRKRGRKTRHDYIISMIETMWGDGDIFPGAVVTASIDTPEGSIIVDGFIDEIDFDQEMTTIDIVVADQLYTIKPSSLVEIMGEQLDTLLDNYIKKS
ncbi:MAG: hypothetical protein WC284_16795 [Candidimonas sp.]